MSDETSLPSLWRPLPVESLQDPLSRASDHVSYDGYHTARHDAVTAWQIVGDGPSARARIFIKDGAAKLDDSHYRFSLGELFHDLPDAKLERADDGKGNCYLSLPRGEYESSIKPLVEMYAMFMEQPEDTFLHVTSAALGDDDSMEFAHLLHNAPPEVQPAYHRARLQIKGGDWVFDHNSGDYRLFFPDGVRDMADFAFTHGVTSVLGEMKEDMHYHWQRTGDDLMLCVPKLHFDHFLRDALLNPLGEYISTASTLDFSDTHAPAGKTPVKAPVISLMQRRVEKDILGALPSRWERATGEADWGDDIHFPMCRLTIANVGAHQDAYARAACAFIADRYPSADRRPHLEVRPEGNGVVIEVSVDRYAAIQADAQQYRHAHKEHGRS